ncbi:MULTISPECIES: hypothetical protein [unclassified Morganella (in: enterobacteria)]|uniref:hypothetical protein n=1 Tax=unclassified Morganella (in: enterobacteria) TaxID=2676694 RepID=UPI0029435791|nr:MULTISPECIES: hypothetical protein [unclassified Morganella (in: enterobacteria)]
MKNNEFNINQVYSMIQSFYIDKMPYPTDFDVIDAINIFIRNHFNSNSRITKSDDGSYEYHGITEMPTDDWDAFVCMYTEREIHFFQNKENILNLISDLTELQKWLISEEYITEHGVIKGKMIDNLKLV